MAHESLAPLSPPEMPSQEAGRPDGTASPRRPCTGFTREQAGSKRAGSRVFPCMAGRPVKFPRSPHGQTRETNAKIKARRCGPIPTYACTPWAQVLVRGRATWDHLVQRQHVEHRRRRPGASPTLRHPVGAEGGATRGALAEIHVEPPGGDEPQRGQLLADLGGSLGPTPPAHGRGGSATGSGNSPAA